MGAMSLVKVGTADGPEGPEPKGAAGRPDVKQPVRAPTTASRAPRCHTRRMKQPYGGAAATSRLGRDFDPNVEALPYALRHDAEVLEDLEAATQAFPVGGLNLRRQPHRELADAQPAALVPHHGPFDPNRKGLHLDARLARAEEEAGSQTVSHGHG